MYQMRQQAYPPTRIKIRACNHSLETQRVMLLRPPLSWASAAILETPLHHPHLVHHQEVEMALNQMKDNKAVFIRSAVISLKCLC